MAQITAWRRSVLIAVLWAAPVGAAGWQEDQRPRTPAIPVEPISAILSAFQSHSVVALGDAHGNEQAHAFLLSLIRDAWFATAVNDIVVEFGSARYQDVMDRFVRGEEIKYEVLRQVWQNATMPHAANDLPMYEEVLRTVRTVNASLPRERQLRVLLGEPPIDWDKVKNRADHQKWIEMRDSYPAALIRLEVLAKERHALLLYGQLHYQRQQVLSNFQMDAWQAQTIVSLLEHSGPTRVFTIWAHPRLADIQADVASWRVPRLATVRGTVLGAVDASSFVGEGIGNTRFAVRDSKIMPIPRSEWRTLRTEDQLDAVLYLGPPSAMTEARLPRTVCSQPGYLDMRLRRIALAGIPQAEADKLKELCADVRRE
jgi:hypothetical protein